MDLNDRFQGCEKVWNSRGEGPLKNVLGISASPPGAVNLDGSSLITVKHLSSCPRTAFRWLRSPSPRPRTSISCAIAAPPPPPNLRHTTACTEGGFKCPTDSPPSLASLDDMHWSKYLVEGIRARPRAHSVASLRFLGQPRGCNARTSANTQCRDIQWYKRVWVRLRCPDRSFQQLPWD